METKQPIIETSFMSSFEVEISEFRAEFLSRIYDGNIGTGSARFYVASRFDDALHAVLVRCGLMRSPVIKARRSVDKRRSHKKKSTTPKAR